MNAVGCDNYFCLVQIRVNLVLAIPTDSVAKSRSSKTRLALRGKGNPEIGHHGGKPSIFEKIGAPLLGVSNDICTGLAGYRNKHQRFVEDYGVWTGCGELWGLRLLGCNFRARAAAAKAVTRMEAAYVSTSTHAHPFHLRLSLLFIVFLCWAVSRCFHSVGSPFASYLFHTLFPIHTWGVGKWTVNYQQNPFHSAECGPDM